MSSVPGGSRCDDWARQSSDGWNNLEVYWELAHPLNSCSVLQIAFKKKPDRKIGLFSG